LSLKRETKLKKIQRLTVPAGLPCFYLGSAACSALTGYSIPTAIRLWSDWTAPADGLPMDVNAATTYLRDGKYSHAYFDFSGS